MSWTVFVLLSMRGASMGYEIEFKLIDIKDINKIQYVEETEGPFGDDVKVVCRHDITDEYCKTIMQRAMTRIAIECEWRYIGCTERIGHHEFEVSGPVNKYIVIFQQDTYEWNVQLTVEIGYKNSCHKSEQSYDAFLEKLKLAIKNSMVRDWYKCVWISDSQSLWLSREVYSEIYMAENELRAFVSKVMIDNFGAEWHDRPEFSKLSASIELNADNVKRNVPNFANIDVNLYTVTLEGLMDTVQSDIYTDAMSSDSEVQKRIKSKIFSTTQLDKMKSALDFLRNQYTKKYNIWDKFFIPFIDKPEEFQTSLTSFIANRNHVAHNKLLDYSAKEKMLYDTHAFRGYIKEAVRKFDSENRSEEVEETLQAIEDQKEYEREAHLEIVQSEAGISIRDRKKILALFREVIRDIYRDIHEILYFNEVLDVNEINSLKDEMDEQLLFTIFNGRQELLNVYGLVDIDDSEGATSVLKISVVGGNDEDVATESIEYVNGEAEYNLEQTSYMPVVKDSLDDGNKEAVKEAVNEFVLRIMDDCETMGYSEERRAEEDGDADAADILENR